MKLNELLGIEFPIIQGAMAGIATGEFAAACSNAGGLGIIATGALRGGPEALRREIRRCRELTDKPFGVNLVIQGTDAAAFARVIVEEKVGVVTTGNGNPARVEYRCIWGSNPEATANVMVAHARAAVRMAEEGRKGAFTILDIPPAYFSLHSKEELLAKFM